MKYSVSQISEINKNNITKNDNYKIINYLDTSSLIEGSFENITPLTVGVDKIPSRAKRKVQVDDILISTVRPNQKHYGIIDESKKNLIVSTGFAVLTPNKKYVDPYFLYKYLTLSETTNLLQSIAENSTSAYPSIKPSVIGDLEIDIPELKVQKLIGKFLMDLDAKIEVNKSLIMNLNQLSHTIFRRWFVDFEFPENTGETYLSQSSGRKMVESELGKVPIDWTVTELGEIIVLSYGKPLKKQNRIEGPYPVYGSNGMVDFHNDFLVQGPGIVIGRKGNPGTVNFEYGNFYPIDTTFYVERKNGKISLNYLYFLLYNQNLSNLSADSAVPGLNRNIVYKNKVIIPDHKTLSLFDEVITPILEKAYWLNVESLKIQALRHTLLPKLLYREIKIPLGSEELDHVQL